jgi:putative transposase
MPSGLKRFHESGQSHFITFCCYHRHPMFVKPGTRRIFELALERVRLRFRLHVYGYVVMPEHVHLLLSEPESDTMADAIKSLKQRVSRRLIGEAEHFWQKRYYDFNVRNHPLVCREASLYSSQAGEARIVQTPGGLGGKQFSPLRHRPRRKRGD